MSIVFLVCAVGLLIGGAIKAEMLLLWVSGALWIIYGVASYLSSNMPATGVWDWQGAASFISFFVGAAAFLYGVSIYNKSRRELRAEHARLDAEDNTDIIDEDDDASAEVRRQQAIFESRVGKRPKARRRNNNQKDLEYMRRHLQ